MNRRCKMDIFAEILTEAKEGATKTRIMYRSNVSYFQLKRYLNELRFSGLIGVQRQLYKTTGMGLYFLRLYDEIGSLVKKIEVIKA